MEYVADTVAIIRHFSKAGKIGKSAGDILDGVKEGEHRLYLSVVSMVEILYLSEKKRINIDLDETMDLIGESENYDLFDLSPAIVKIAKGITFPEIFDRLIISTARYLDVPLITSDRAIRKSDFVETIWS